MHTNSNQTNSNKKKLLRRWASVHLTRRWPGLCQGLWWPVHTTTGAKDGFHQPEWFPGLSLRRRSQKKGSRRPDGHLWARWKMRERDAISPLIHKGWSGSVRDKTQVINILLSWLQLVACLYPPSFPPPTSPSRIFRTYFCFSKGYKVATERVNRQWGMGRRMRGFCSKL